MIPASSTSIDTDVLVVGAGPTGLTLAAALATRGVRAVVIDRQSEDPLTSRAAVMHARTLEVLEPLGDVVPALLARGIHAERFSIRDAHRVLVPVDFAPLPTRYPFLLMISQAETEAVLRERLRALGGTVQRPRTLHTLVQDDEGVTATLADGERLRARFVVGADGMHSRVREQAGIGFPGAAYGESFVLADVRLAHRGTLPEREVVLFFAPAGLVVVAPLPGGLVRVVAAVEDAPENIGRADVQALLDERGPGVEHGTPMVGDLLWSSRFRVHHRVAERYRAHRVLLAGDAAHVHSPAGGQGMNAGILDAMLLAESLERALQGDLAALDAYGAQRRPVAQQVVDFADRLTRLATAPRALRGARNLLLSTLGRIPLYRRALAWRLSGLVYRPREVSRTRQAGEAGRASAAVGSSASAVQPRRQART